MRSSYRRSQGRISCSGKRLLRRRADANAPTTFTAMSENVFPSMFANNGRMQNCIGLMFANKTPRQRSRSTSPRRDPKRRCSRRVCDKRDPQKQFADRHPRANSCKDAPRRFAPTIIAHQGAFDANAPTSFTAMPENVFLSVFTNNSLLQNCMWLMFASKTPRQRSRSTSPRRDPKMRSRSVCDKRDPSERLPINIRTPSVARARLGDSRLLSSPIRAHLTQMRLLPSMHCRKMFSCQCLLTTVSCKIA